MLPNLHLSFTLHFLDLVGKELPLILASKNPKDILKKRRVSPSHIFNIEVQYDNKEPDGQVLVTLDTKAEQLKCYHNETMNPDDKRGYVARQILNCFIIVICILSLLLCCRCLAKARYLCRETNKFFKLTQNKALSGHEEMEVVDM
ncbi:mucolipin-3 [Trichonephila clavipes]|nr:mucolipin-3 [Trichonephila clavipes]